MRQGLQTAEQQVYRLALYGVRSSGKTCILSALSLPRIAHPDGLSCSWIESVRGHDLPSGDPSRWTTDDPYHVGWKWLNEQRNRLKQGELPAPNPNREDAMRFRFDFGSPDHGVRHVELIDYSGELITATASELAAKLRDHMRTHDGLLILAEVPYPGRDQAPLTDDLEKLKGAFLRLMEERSFGPKTDWPIAILFNKWDRRSDGDRDGSGVAKDLIGGFLAQTPAPPHRSLIDTITNAVGSNNTRCFSVSAFGSHRISSDGAEIPQLNGEMLNSYRLEDGFVWVAERHDELLVERLENAAGAASWWAFWQLLFGRSGSVVGNEPAAWTQWLRGISPCAGVSAAWKLRRCLPTNGDLTARTNIALRRFGMKLVSQFVLGVLAMLVLLVGIETSFDGIHYRDVLAMRDDPAAQPEQLQRGEEWLRSYFVSPSFRHQLSCLTILDRSKAADLLAKFRTRRDEALWETVDKADAPQTRLILVRKYLDAFPSGLHHTDALTFVAISDRQQNQVRNEDHLKQVQLKIDAVQATTATQLDVLHQLGEQIGNLPYPDVSSETIVGEQQRLRNLIADKQLLISEAVRQADWDKFKQNYFSLMRNNDVADAARELELRTPKEASLAQLVGEFAAQAPSMIRKKVHDAVKDRSWQVARNSARLAVDPNVVRLLRPDEIKKLQTLGEEVDEAEDRDLYGQIVKYKPQCADQLDAYLNRAPLKTMNAEVVAYKKFVDQMKGTLELTLDLTSIEWHENYWAWRVNYYNDVTVQVKGEPLITQTGIQSAPTSRSAQIGSGTFRAGLNETITLDVSVVAKYGWISTASMSGGGGQWTGTPNQLRQGLTIPLNGDGFSNKATFSLMGVPPEPPLPEWKRR